MRNQKQRVADLLNSIETGEPGPVGVINPHQYVPRHLDAADGLAGFKALLALLEAGSAKVSNLKRGTA